MRARRWSAAYLLVVVMSAGCSNSTTPPSPVPSTPNALIIDGVRALEEGETVALTLSVGIPGGLLKSVAEDAAVTWSSTNTAIATVSDRGIVTALKAGKVDIKASFDQLNATANMTVTPGPSIRPGLVRTIPDRVAIAGATVTVVDSRGAAKVVQSDKFGQFSMRLPFGPTRFTIAASGYETSDLSIDVRFETNLRFGLLPVGSGIREQAGVPWEGWP